MVHLVASALLSLISLGAALPTTATTNNNNNNNVAREPAGCLDFGTEGFEWQVENFDYHASYIFSTPAHQNSWGYVNFNLTNSAFPEKGICSASSSQLSDFFYGTMKYYCTFPDEISGVYNVATGFNFSRPSGELDLEQKWKCNRDDIAYPTTITATGNATLNLDCTDTTWTNDNWTIGQIYSSREIKCTTVSLPVKADHIFAIA